MAVCRDCNGNVISCIRVPKPVYYVFVQYGGLPLAEDYQKLITKLVKILESSEDVGGVVDIREPTRLHFVNAYKDGKVLGNGSNNKGIIFNYGHGASNEPELLFERVVLNGEVRYNSRVHADEIRSGGIEITHPSIISKNYVCHQKKYEDKWDVLPGAEFYFSDRTPESELLPRFLNDLVNEINRIFCQRGIGPINGYEFKPLPTSSPNDIKGCIGFIGESRLVCELCNKISRIGCERECVKGVGAWCSGCSEVPCQKCLDFRGKSSDGCGECDMVPCMKCRGVMWCNNETKTCVGTKCKNWIKCHKNETNSIGRKCENCDIKPCIKCRHLKRDCNKCEIKPCVKCQGAERTCGPMKCFQIPCIKKQPQNTD